MIIYLKVKDFLGIEPNIGYCADKIGVHIYSYAILSGINILLSIYTLYCLKYNLPKIERVKKERARMMKSYTILLILLIIQTFVCLIDVFWLKNDHQPVVLLWIFNVMSWMFFSVSLPFFIFILLNEGFRKEVFSCCFNSKTIIHKIGYSELGINLLVKMKNKNIICTILGGIIKHFSNINENGIDKNFK